MDETSPSGHVDVRTRLLQELQSLEEESAVSREATAPVQLDQSAVGRVSRVDAIQSQQVALVAKAHRERRIAAIHLALRRISNGSYGLCSRCKQPIQPARLEMDPAAATCIRCANR